MASNKDLAALLPYVQSVCRGFCSRRRVSDPDAYESEAALALVEEGRKWAPGRGMGLKSFVRQRVVWRLLRFHKAELERQRQFEGGILDPDEIPVDGAGEGRQWTTERLLALELAMRDADLSAREEDVPAGGGRGDGGKRDDRSSVAGCSGRESAAPCACTFRSSLREIRLCVKTQW
jgi:hypothetical protein